MNVKMICKSSLLKITMAVALVVLPQLVFAYDGTVTGDKLGNCSRKIFINEIDDEDFVKEQNDDLAKALDTTMEKFFKIDDSNADDEDDQLLEDLSAYIEKTYDVDDGDIFAHWIIRNSNDDSADGWYVLSHWTKKNGWLHAMYYFSTSNAILEK